MDLLFRERNEVRFHQPSRMQAAKRVRELQSKGQLKATDDFPSPPVAMAEEFGSELSVLLQLANQNNGMVICVHPINKVGSLIDEKADTSQYDDLILSTMDICALLHNEGKIDTATYRRASLWLNNQGQTEFPNRLRTLPSNPIYIDGLALSYLQDAGILHRWPMRV